MAKKRARSTEPEFDVCLSFAGEDRPYVEQVAEQLKMRGMRVFYDTYELVDLWGKDLYTHLAEAYRSRARYCVLFVSRHYAKKVWTNHERMSAQERALHSAREYILPVRFDNTKLPGLRATTGYIDLRGLEPADLAELVTKEGGPATSRDVSATGARPFVHSADGY